MSSQEKGDFSCLTMPSFYNTLATKDYHMLENELGMLSVKCPKCGALDGDWCRRPDGRFQEGALHLARWNASPGPMTMRAYLNRHVIAWGFNYSI